MDNLQPLVFVVDKTFYCLWDDGSFDHNLNFIDSIDPGYFDYIASSQATQLGDEEKPYAATLLRTTYSHALESHFALLSAAVQAPDCVLGWIHKYQTGQLRNVINQINGGITVYNKYNLSEINWQRIAEVLFPFEVTDQIVANDISELFASLWQNLAKDFLDGEIIEEYNSIKHGSRIRVGGTRYVITVQEDESTDAPSSEIIMDGEFGTSFYTINEMGNKKNFCVANQTLYWHPKKLEHALKLISLSMRNLITSLKIMNGVDPEDTRFYYPKDKAVFNEPWQEEFAEGGFSIGIDTRLHAIKPLSEREMKEIYNGSML